MYFIRKITKTKKRTNKSSFIVSLPRKLERRIASYDGTIARKLENFTRFRYFYQDVENPRCFIFCICDVELPQSGLSCKDRTTTIQRSGRTSRYVIIPKKVCERFGWKTGTELVIGFSYGISKEIRDAIYRDVDFIPAATSPVVLAIKFQRYQDMKGLYSEKLAEERSHLDEVQNDLLWKNRHDSLQFERTAQAIDRWRKNMRWEVWGCLFRESLVAVSYNEYVKLRADNERERKRRRRKLKKQRQGAKSTWNYRKSLIKGYGTDWDASREALLDDPDTLNEMRTEDPKTYRQYGFTNRYDDDENDEDRGL